MIRYLDSKAALSTLADHRLKVSQAGKFNDPFEFCFTMTGREDGDLPEDFVRKVIDHNVRVLCVSDPDRITPDGDILMWSHYGRSHSGCRVHLSKEFLEAKAALHWEVEYETNIPTANMDYVSDEGSFEAFNAISQGLRAKGSSWAYEKEVRFFFTKNQCKASRRHGFHYIHLPANAIRRVDIGIETDPRDERELLAILHQRKFRNTCVFKAERKRGAFAIQYKKYERA